MGQPSGWALARGFRIRMRDVGLTLSVHAVLLGYGSAVADLPLNFHPAAVRARQGMSESNLSQMGK